MNKKLVDNVLSFINECSKEIGRFAEQDWNIDLWNECQEMGMESPIEQILYCALKTVRKLNYITEDQIVDNWDDRKLTYIVGLGFYPERQIEKYRVDFLVGNYIYHKQKGQIKTEVVVECDSQQFHDRTEQDRRYEKQRDRFLQTQGYKIFHYTGSEICQKPLKIAQEIIAFVMERDKEEILIDSNLE